MVKKETKMEDAGEAKEAALAMRPEIGLMEREAFEFGITAEEAKKKLQQIKLFQAVVQELLQEDLDYGVIPGTKKPTLLKPGAEKIAKLLNCYDDYEEIDSVERWDDKNPFFQYKFKCTFRDIATGFKISSGVGSCNSKEARFRYRWIPVWELTEGQSLIKDSVPKKETKKNNKTYTFYRFENDDIFSQVNTVMKQAAKRALIAAALSAGRLSNIFTQDVEDTPIAKEPAEQTNEPITNEQKTTIARRENIIVDDFGIDPEVMQAGYRKEFGPNKEIKDLTKLEAQSWLDKLQRKIENERKKKKQREEDKARKAEEAEDPEELAAHKQELKFVMKQYHDLGGKELTQKESDEMDAAETLGDYQALLKKWKPRRDALEKPGHDSKPAGK